jgi:thioredoxin-like negative regulator of GroEL
VFEAASDQHPDILFAKVDTEAHPGIAARFGVMAIPTLMGFRHGRLVFSQPGALPPAVLEAVIDRIRKLEPAEPAQAKRATN